MENTAVKKRVVVDASLTRDGSYLKIHFDEAKQPAPEGGWKNSWDESATRRELRYRWSNDTKAVLGRMHYNEMGDLLYPVVPVFEAFARAERESLDPEEVVQKDYVMEEEEIPQEEVIKKVLEGLKLESKTVEIAKRNLAQLFTAPLGKDEDIQAIDEAHSLNTCVEKVFADLSDILVGYVKVRSREVKLRRRKRKEVRKVSYRKHIVFSFKSGLEVHMGGQTADTFELLLPVIQRIRERMMLVRRFRNDGVTNGDFDYEVKGEMEPFEHQKVMYKIHDILPHSANLSQMGTGKSLAVIMSIDKRLQRGEVRPGHILIICPATLLETWVERHIKKGAPHLRAAIISGSYHERLQTIMNRDGQVDVFLTNPETFSMRSKMEHNGKEITIPLAPLFTLVEWDMVVIDEAHKIKNPEAIRTQAIINAFKDVPYSIIMSGTINANKLYDLHAPFVFLNKAKNFNSLHMELGSGEEFSLGKMHEQFVREYFQGRGYKKDPFPFTIQELRERMEEVSVRFEKSECFELPDKLYEQRMVEMEPRQAQLYNALKAYLTAELSSLADSGGTVTVMNILAMMVKLAEAANGWIYDDEHQLINLPMNPKLDALMDYIGDLGDDDKMVVWSRFTNDLHTIYDAIRKEYGEESVAIIHGGESCSLCDSRKRDRFSIQERFNDLKHPLRFVVVNSAVGSHGIDLTGATYEAFFSNSFVKTDRTQAEDRCHRFGMRDNLTIVDFVMKGTVDEDVLMALKSWKSMTAALLGHLGIDINKLFKDSGGGAHEAPVITEHIAQKPGECALCAIAMVAGVSVDVVRAWMTTQLNDAKKYKGQHPYILMAVEHFIPWMKEEWAAYMASVDTDKINLSEVKLPSEKSGIAIIRHEKMKKISHAVAFSNGYVYDPARNGRITFSDYGVWMASASYSLEKVFEMPQDRKLVLPKIAGEQGESEENEQQKAVNE